MRPSYAEIRSRFDAEHQAGGQLHTANDLPLSYEAITPEWLTCVLGKNPGAEVMSCRLGPPDEGTSSRRRIFLDWNEAGKRAGLPASVFCKGSQRLESRYMVGMNGGIEAEVTFYNRVRGHLAIEAPRPLFANFDPRSLNSIIILEDMTGSSQFCQLTMDITIELAESQMKLLAALHAKYYQSAELASTLARFNDWENYFAITVDQAGFGEACQRGFEQAEGVIPPPLFRRAREVWPATLKCVALHHELPRGLLHSDPHLRNWYIAASGEMGLNDWQCACKGNWGRDVSYAITTSLTSENRRAWERDLLGFYLESLAAAGGPKLRFDEAWTIYRQQTFSALAWWTGTLGQPPEAPIMQPREVSLEFIARMTRAIDDLDALDSFASN